MKKIIRRIQIIVLNIFSIIGIILSLAALATYFDTAFTRHFLGIKYSEEGKATGILKVFLCVGILQLVGILIQRITSRKLLEIEFSKDEEQKQLDFQYKVRGCAYVVSMIILCAFILFAVPSLIRGAFSLLGDLCNSSRGPGTGRHIYNLLNGLIQIGITFFMLKVETNENFCKKCHRKMVGASWRTDRSYTETKAKFRDGGSTKIGSASDGNGNTFNFYKDNGMRELNKNVTTHEKSRKCPFCGHWHYKKEYESTSWK